MQSPPRQHSTSGIPSTRHTSCTPTSHTSTPSQLETSSADPQHLQPRGTFSESSPLSDSSSEEQSSKPVPTHRGSRRSSVERQPTPSWEFPEEFPRQSATKRQQRSAATLTDSSTSHRPPSRCSTTSSLQTRSTLTSSPTRTSTTTRPTTWDLSTTRTSWSSTTVRYVSSTRTVRRPTSTTHTTTSTTSARQSSPGPTRSSPT